MRLQSLSSSAYCPDRANRTHTQSLRSSRRWTYCRRKKSLRRSRAQSAATPERTCSTRSRSLPRSACGWNATITRKVLNTEARSTRCGTAMQHKYPIPVHGSAGEWGFFYRAMVPPCGTGILSKNLLVLELYASQKAR